MGVVVSMGGASVRGGRVVLGIRVYFRIKVGVYLAFLLFGVVCWFFECIEEV